MTKPSNNPIALLFHESRVKEWVSQISPLIKQGMSFGVLSSSIQQHFGFPNAPEPYGAAYSLNIKEKRQHLVCFTAGSNGHPKAIVRSYQSWVNSFNIQKELLRYTSNALSMIVGQCSHSLHFFGLMESLYRNVIPLVLPTFSPKFFFESANSHQPHILYVTPAHLGLLLRHFNSFDLPPATSFQHVLVGGATINSHTAEETQLMFPNADIREFFGATETSYIAIKTQNSPQKSVGKLCPGVSVRILDAHQKPLPVGDVGNIWVHSNQLFTKTVLGEDQTTVDSNGYVHVGDMGYLDETDHLYYCGRNNHQVTIAGKNILLTPIENFIKSILKTDEIALVSVSDTLRENRLTLLTTLVLSSDQQRDLLSAVRSEFGSLSSPKQIKIISTWPLLPNGKTNRNELRKLSVL